MLELLRRRRRHDPKSLLLAAAGGAVATSAVNVIAKAGRRAHARDRVTSAASQTADLMSKAARDARNRASGAAAVARGAVRRDHASTEKVVARVRSKLGRVVSHPHAVEVCAEDGHLVLSGHVLGSEVDRLLREVRHVRGVREVESRLEVHERADDVPALQGAGRPPRPPEILQEHWTPSLRIGAGVAGALSAAMGAARLPSLAGLGLGGLGALLLLRASADKPIGRALGLRGARRSVELQKTLTIDAPTPQVFAYWADFERMPEFMDHVLDVKTTGEGRSRWKVRGPLGAVVEWDAEITSLVPNELIAWRTVGDSLVKHAGVVRFEPTPDGRGTRLDVHLGYNPIVGYLGHGLAVLFGVDPKKSLDQDLLRMKSLLEEGKATAHGHQVTREPRPAPEGSGA